MTAFVGGCASRQPELIPDEGPDAMTVYQRHIAGLPIGGELARRTRTDVSEVTAESADEEAVGARVTPEHPNLHADSVDQTLAQLNREFPEVPNYQLVGWVIGHVNADGDPIPTYPTKFWLYRKHHYAKPGEAKP